MQKPYRKVRETIYVNANIMETSHSCAFHACCFLARKHELLLFGFD